MKYITLLPARMGRLELRNRIVFPAMVTNYCSVRGEVTDRLIAYHQERARGGAGLIITEATYISPDGKSFPHQLSIAEDGLLPGLRRLAEGVHAAGARIAVQLCHAGRQTSRAVSGLPLIAPSAMRFGDDVTHAMRQEDIERVIGEYARASVRAREAGFDAVELHAGNGYLPQQFLSPLTNFRQDNYGGSLENRIRFSIETIAGGLTLEEGLTAARILAREDIDAIDVTAGMREGGMWVTPPLTLPHGTHIAQAAAVRQSISARKPVIGIGRITSIALADSFIKEGKADFVVMGRALLADPELPLKTLQERGEDIRPCIGCNEGCIGRLARGLDITCAVNPTVGNEYCKRQTTTSTPLKVLVVEAGPAGLVAACATRQRGHTVTVMEKEPVYGGKLRIAALPPFKQELFTYVTYLEKHTRKLGVTICCDTEAPPDSCRPEAGRHSTGYRCRTVYSSYPRPHPGQCSSCRTSPTAGQPNSRRHNSYHRRGACRL